jgi:DNA-3-methyladenine glycosylase II
MGPVSFGAAARILAERDPVIARLVAEAGPPRLSRPTESHFGTLVRAIVYQQLAGRAAAAIHGRLIAAVGGNVLPEPLLALTDEQLRAVGLSRNKMASLRDLAAKVLDGTVVLSPRGVARESDDDIVARLSAVRGIGPWTAEMFLIFQLRRLDVWPVGDLGVRRGYGLAWQVPEPTARELKPLGEPFRPYRSVAAWYCWRAAELYAGAADSALTRLTGLARPGRAMMVRCRNSPWRRLPASYSNGPGAAAAAAPRPPSSAATRRCSARPSSLWSAARA